MTFEVSLIKKTIFLAKVSFVGVWKLDKSN